MRHKKFTGWDNSHSNAVYPIYKEYYDCSWFWEALKGDEDIVFGWTYGPIKG